VTDGASEVSEACGRAAAKAAKPAMARVAENFILDRFGIASASVIKRDYYNWRAGNLAI